MLRVKQVHRVQTLKILNQCMVTLTIMDRMAHLQSTKTIRTLAPNITTEKTLISTIKMGVALGLLSLT